MTLDHAVALSLLFDLSRVNLTARLQGDDPELLDLASRRLGDARATRERAAADGIGVLPWFDPGFPASLLAIPDCPPALWYRGSIEALSPPVIAIVGSRAASAVALETASRLAADLAAHGITIASGLARGVDSAAHRGALRHGRTIAVLGSGVDCIYPKEHTALAGEVARDGVVISEYAPGTLPLKQNFPMRNRLISGLSRAVVVIEAAEGSGSLITAGSALEQGREVMVVPGNVLTGRNTGGHALIRDGARMVQSAHDILEDLGFAPSASSAGGDEGTAAASTGSVDSLVRCMDFGHPYHLDALAVLAGLEACQLLPRLSDLELRGVVRRVGGGRFMRQT